MGADHDVDAAGGQAFHRLLHFLGALEARQLGNAHRPVGKAVAEVLEVLFGQQRGGHQHGHLFTTHHRHKGGAQRDFGLAKADVAAHQAVHRAAAGHVVDHRLDSAGLVRGFLEAEAGGKGVVIVVVQRKAVAFARCALRVQVQQLGGGVAGFFGGLFLGLVPGRAAQPVQLYVVAGVAGVAADQLQLRYRHVQRGAFGVLQLHHFGFAFA